ncbi:hypothetical protein LZ480_07990 [Solibacillus sp. MA9]|uniref:DUF4181 domain-containing protein n=1 Tax=Solibacillus palustris TaxID=2908203 RepID=A0ABS9UBW2_9BACL|nr:hypothetical protein [Solibacillus sp. MA9]MCH7321832.1 hypothetical protein [Solibacillus sp. MA9]
MLDEKQLNHLQSIKIDEVEKQADFERIQRRINKKPFHWQLPAVAFSIVLLVLLLVATMPIPDNTVNLSSDAYLTSILVRDGEGDPKSNYYLGVSQTMAEDELKTMQASLDTLQQIEEPPVKPKVSKSYRFTYSDGSNLVFYEYLTANRIYIKDVHKGLYYEFTEGSGFISFMNTRYQTWQYLLLVIIFVLLFGGNMYIDKKMRVEEDPKRKLPMHSHYMQSIMTICYIFVLFLFFVGGMSSNANIHIAGIYLLGFVFAFINIIIEQKYDNNGWRKLRFVNISLMFPTYLYLFIQL